MKYLTILAGFFFVTSSAFAASETEISGQWCIDYDSSSDFRIELELNSNKKLDETAYYGSTAVDGASGTWSLDGDLLLAHGFWVFEENFRVPEDYTDTFSVDLVDKNTLILKRAKNTELLPEYSKPRIQTYELKRCEPLAELTS